MRRITEEILLSRTTAEWVPLMDRAGIPVAPVNTVDRAFTEPCVVQRNMVVSVEQPRAGRVHMAGNPVKMSRTPGEEFAPTPALGEHTTEALSSLLGYSAERMALLLTEGAAAQFQPHQ